MSKLTWWEVLTQEPAGGIRKEIVFGEDVVAKARERAAPANRDSIEISLSSSVQKQVKDLLDVPVTDRIIEAFAAYRDLLAYTDPVKYPPHQTVSKSYGEVTLNLRVSPSIRMRMDHVIELPPIKIEAAMQLKLVGVVLRILGGRIVGLRCSSVNAEGTLKVGKTKAYETPKARVFDGFEKDPLDPPIPILAPGRRAEEQAAPAAGGRSG